MLPKFNKKRLENGLEIYHIPLNLGSNVISVNLFYNVGSRDEKLGKTGIAHMLEHLNFKSTKNRKAGEFDAIVKSFGGVNNASTSFDYTKYFIKCSKSNLDMSLNLYADIMENLNLIDEEFRPERDVVYEERLWRTDNDPSGYLFFRLYNHAFIYHPYHWTPIGFRGDIKNWSIEDIREFHSIYYQPKNAVLIISGDIDEETAFRLASKNFSHIKNRGEIPSFHTFEPVQDGERNAIIYKESDVEILAMAYKIPPFNHPDQTAINAVINLLSESKSSVMNRVLVDEKNLVNQIEIYNMSSKDENLMIIFAILNPSVKGEIVKEEIFKILDEAKSGEISDDDMQKIKNSAKTQFIYSFDSASKVASIFGSYIIRGDLEALYKQEEILENLNKDDIKEALIKYFDRKFLTTLILRKE